MFQEDAFREVADVLAAIGDGLEQLVDRLHLHELARVAQEVREHIIDTVGEIGGHFGANLGTCELAVALHSVLDSPRDKILWDVGHQAYPHKILTGRRDRIRTLRQGGGLSGFTKRSESEYDPFGAAHSSTSISAALGFAVANKLSDRPGRAIAGIGEHRQGRRQFGLERTAAMQHGIERARRATERNLAGDHVARGAALDLAVVD